MAEIDRNSENLTAWPEGITAECEKLELYANKIKKVPPAIGQLKKLKLLNVFNNAIGLSLPDEIGTLENLEEVNLAANKLAKLGDAHFASWANVQILNLNDNNLMAIGSLAPMLKLEELRLYGNNLTALPTLAGSHPELKIFEIHKNRVEDAADEYFKATPALERLSLWGNQLKTLPSSITSCSNLLGVQAHENAFTSLPAGPWPASLETLFIQETGVTALPDALKACSLKRVNLGKLSLDGAADALAGELEKMILGKKDGIFWGKDGLAKKSA